MFCRYDLRTTDPDAARVFYADVVGLDFAAGTDPAAADDPSCIAVWLLHEQARARGAPPHWLGQIGVTRVEATRDRFVELGAERLSPPIQGPDGVTYATLRDPHGAVVAVRESRKTSPRSPVAWHHLHTSDLDRSWAAYAELFSWRHTETVEAVDPPGGFHLFAWDSGSESIGSMANTARAPGIHPHWLFYFSVADIEAAVAKVTSNGGTVSSAIATLPNGARIVACEDGQKCAFGLHAGVAR